MLATADVDGSVRQPFLLNPTPLVMIRRIALTYCLLHSLALAHLEEADGGKRIPAAPLPAAPLGQGEWSFTVEAGWARPGDMPCIQLIGLVDQDRCAQGQVVRRDFTGCQSGTVGRDCLLHRIPQPPGNF